MGALEEVIKMQQQGKSENEIFDSLRQKGFSAKDVYDSIAQTKIKNAVEQPTPEPMTEEPLQMIRPDIPQGPTTQEYQGMQQSIFRPMEGSPEASQEVTYQSNQIQEAPSPSQYSSQEAYPSAQEYPEYADTPQSYGEYPSYQPYQQASLSSDTVTEISEQVVTERLSEIRKQLEKIIDFRTTIDAKIEYLDERLKRIEKIIDNLQSSILQKVGTYVTNIDDIKKELIETQKSFKSILPQTKHNIQSGHKPRHHHP